MKTDPDVIVVGGGIAGLAAALRLRKRGLRPLVLEQNDRVGGRMRTDRRDGFTIDTGVTVFSNRYPRMKSLVKELDLTSAMSPIDFSLEVHNVARIARYRGRNVFDLLTSSDLSLPAKIAAMRAVGRIAMRGPHLLHGESPKDAYLDDRTSSDWIGSLGSGGDELFWHVIEPGLRGAVGDLTKTSRQQIMTIARNLMGAGMWTMDGGVDLIPNAIASRVDVCTEVSVSRITPTDSGISVRITKDGTDGELFARAAVLAIPGHLIPDLHPGLPPMMLDTLADTQFSSKANVHVALRARPKSRAMAVGVVGAAPTGMGILELEHNRVRTSCPPGQAMISAFLVDAPDLPADCDDETLRRRGSAMVASAFPESVGDTLFAHTAHWPIAIPHFPVGRFREVAQLRKALPNVSAPVDLAGDWLDGLASESAVRTGDEAAERIAARLAAAK